MDNETFNAGEKEDFTPSGQDDGAGQADDKGFSIPQEYANKGWAQTFKDKTGDELRGEVFKMLDSSQSLVGKKAGDYLTNTNLKELENFEEIKNILLPQIAPQYQVPESAEQYSLNDVLKNENGEQAFEYPDEVINHFSDIFKEKGLSVEQGQGLLKSFTDFEMSHFYKLTDSKELEDNLGTMFKNNKEAQTQCTNLIKEFISDEEKKFLDETAPNSFVEILHKVAKGVSEAYGYKERSFDGGTNKGPMTQSDKDKEYDRISGLIKDLDNRPHKQGERDGLVAKLIDLQR